jgi:hypothetical protein
VSPTYNTDRFLLSTPVDIFGGAGGSDVAALSAMAHEHMHYVQHTSTASGLLLALIRSRQFECAIDMRNILRARPGSWPEHRPLIRAAQGELEPGGEGIPSELESLRFDWWNLSRCYQLFDSAPLTRDKQQSFQNSLIDLTDLLGQLTEIDTATLPRPGGTIQYVFDIDDDSRVPQFTVRTLREAAAVATEAIVVQTAPQTKSDADPHSSLRHVVERLLSGSAGEVFRLVSKSLFGVARPTTAGQHMRALIALCLIVDASLDGPLPFSRWPIALNAVIPISEAHPSTRFQRLCSALEQVEIPEDPFGLSAQDVRDLYLDLLDASSLTENQYRRAEYPRSMLNDHMLAHLSTQRPGGDSIQQFDDQLAISLAVELNSLLGERRVLPWRSHYLAIHDWWRQVRITSPDLAAFGPFIRWTAGSHPLDPAGETAYLYPPVVAAPDSVAFYPPSLSLAAISLHVGSTLEVASRSWLLGAPWPTIAGGTPADNEQCSRLFNLEGHDR